MKKRSKQITSAINGREKSERMKLDEGRKRLPPFPLLFLSRWKKRKNGEALWLSAYLWLEEDEGESIWLEENVKT